MKPSTLKLIEKTIYRDFENAGITLKDAKTKAAVIRLARVFPTSVEVNELVPYAVIAVTLARLRKQKEPSIVELDRLLTEIKELPYQLRPFFSKEMKTVVTTLPRGAGGGRPKKLSAQQSQETCEQIGALYAKGVPLEDAFVRMGTRIGVSARTIKRAWQKRGQREGDSNL